MTNVVETAMRMKKPGGAAAARSAHDPETVYLHYHRLVRQIARRVFMTVSSALPLEDLVQYVPLPLDEALYRQLDIAFILLWHKRNNHNTKVLWLRDEIKRLYHQHIGAAGAG